MMNKIRASLTPHLLTNCLLAILSVAITTVILYLIGLDTLGEAVIALLYLVPVAWSANRWGQWPGIVAAFSAALAFDFLFIPPFYTFTVGRLEGWLVLVIFLVVAIVIVGRIQDSLSKAHEAVFLYELTSALASQRTPQAVAHTAAQQLQQLFQVDLVQVVFHPDRNTESVVAREPIDRIGKGKPEHVLPLLNSWGLVGEIQIWGSSLVELPSTDSRFLQAFATQVAQALDRTQQTEINLRRNELITPTSVQEK
jgi:K+-sensing histidine kinase KdpD